MRTRFWVKNTPSDGLEKEVQYRGLLDHRFSTWAFEAFRGAVKDPYKSFGRDSKTTEISVVVVDEVIHELSCQMKASIGSNCRKKQVERSI
ncbi:hypothetical protein TNCV_3670331 [Trichonephila clavipes]|nr:hypothetical protein TNCV_3670331 [Trichonephila clavipes]